MSLYTQLDDATIRQIAQQYNIGNIQSWKTLEGGVENTNNLLVCGKKKYVLTLCERKTAEETMVLANILAHLEKEGFNSSKINKNIRGELVSFYQGKPVLLKNYIDGQVVEVFDEGIVKKLGKKIAQLNQIPPIKDIPHQFSYGEQLFREVYENIDHPFADWLTEMHTFILKNLQADLPKALIHGDIFTSNVVIKDGEPVIMDFEESCYYYRLFDLGMAAIGSCSENGQLNWKKIGLLLEGYQSVNELSDLEARHFKNFIVYAATATAFWRFRQFNILAPIEERKDSYKEMQNLANQAKNINFHF